MSIKRINVVKCFNCNNTSWTDDQNYNMIAIKSILNYCYDKFKVRGYLFLNEVYRELGFPQTRQGQIAGWVFDENKLKTVMWTVWSRPDECDIHITFEPINDILYALPDEQQGD